MKKIYISLFIAVFSVLSLSANTFYDQLLTVNANWSHWKMQAPAADAKDFPDERSFLQAHLSAVETILLQADLSGLNPQQRLARKQNLGILHAYILAGKFPQNFYRNFRTPVFIDEFDTHCAVGYLMQQSGHDALARRISAADNYIHVKEITDAELSGWQENSGFSLEELALIQPAYAAPPTAFEQQYACTTAYFESQYNWGISYVQQNGKTPEKPVWYSGECKNGRLNGKWLQYSSPGVLWIEGEFKNGKKDGTWIHYQQYAPQGNPKISSVEHWKNGLLQGLFESFDNSGNRSQQGNYVNGLKEGEWKTWQQGLLSARENYTKGNKDGDCFQYYFYWKDTAKHEVRIHDRYSEGILQTRYWYLSGGALKSKKEIVSPGVYEAVEYTVDGKLQTKGYECFSIHKDSSENLMYPNLPKLYYEQEVFAKCGTWKMFPPFYHYLITVPKYDSVAFVCEKDSVRAIATYWMNGANQRTDSVSYSSLLPFQLYGFYQPQNPAGKEVWSYEKNKLVTHSCIMPNGVQKFNFSYRDGKLENGALYDSSGKAFKTWNVSTFTGKPVLIFQEFDPEHRLLMKGPMEDTTMRTGYWEFYDTLRTVIAKGEYAGGKKEGEWTETKADGSVWEGNYKNGEKAGTWKQVFPKEMIIRREKF